MVKVVGLSHGSYYKLIKLNFRMKGPLLKRTYHLNSRHFCAVGGLFDAISPFFEVYLNSDLILDCCTKASSTLAFFFNMILHLCILHFFFQFTYLG